MTDFNTLVESGQRILAASRLAGTPQASSAEKFDLGDLLVEEDVADAQLGELAEAIGFAVTANSLKSYRDVARAWPVDRRVEASWTTHRTLAKSADRFDLIKPNMTLREAQTALGGRPADAKHPSRWPFEDRVDYLITQLQDETINKAVREQAEERKRTRAVKAAARAVDEERSAEYREALRELRERNNAKDPERAVYDAIFKLRDAREYVRAVGKASTDEQSFVSEHRKPDVVDAMRDLAVSAVEALVALGSTDPSMSRDALFAVADRLQMFNRPKVASGFVGVVIDADE
jgi:hypothetical protein